MPRNRSKIAACLAVVIALGLGSRSEHPAIPIWIARNAGDALWTVAVYFVFAFLRPAATPRRLLVLALATSLAVELSQLWHAEWLESLRRTLPGRLVLGSGWQWEDLPRYTVGAIVGWAIDRSGICTQAETE